MHQNLYHQHHQQRFDTAKTFLKEGEGLSYKHTSNLNILTAPT